MAQNFSPKHPIHMTQFHRIKRNSNEINDISHINQDLQQIAHRDNDVKSSIQNLKRKLHINQPLDQLNFSQSSISIIQTCRNCPQIKKKIQNYKNKLFTLQQQMKIMALQNTKIQKYNKKMEHKVIQLQQQLQRKSKQSQNDLDKQSKTIIQYKKKDLECQALLKQNNSLTNTIQKLKNEINQLRRQLQKDMVLKQDYRNRQTSELEKTIKMYIQMIKEKDNQYENQKRKFQQHLKKQEFEYKEFEKNHFELEEALKKQVRQKQNVIQLINKSINPNSISNINISTSKIQQQNDQSLPPLSQNQLYFQSQKLKLKQNQIQTLKQSCQKHRSQIIQLGNQNLYFKQLISNYEIQLTQQTHQIQQYQIQLNSRLQKSKLHIIKQVEQLKNEFISSNVIENQQLQQIKELQCLYNQSQAKLNQLKNLIPILEQQKSQLENNLQKLQKQNQNMLAHIRNMEYHFENQQKENQKNSYHIKELNGKLQEMVVQMEEKTRRILLYENSTDRIEGDYKKEVRQLERQVKQKIVEIGRLKQEIEKDRSQFAKKQQNLVNQLKKCSQNEQHLKQQTHILNQQKIIIHHQVTRLNQQNLILKKQFLEYKKLAQNLQQTKLSLQKKYQQLLSKYQIQKQKGIELNKQLSINKSSAQQLQKLKEVFEHQRRIYQNEIQSLKLSAKEQSQSKVNQKDIHGKYEVINKQLTSLKDKYNDLDFKNKVLIKQSQNAQSQNISLKQQIKQKSLQIKSLQFNLDQLKNLFKRQQNKISQENIVNDQKEYQYKMKIQALQEEIRNTNQLNTQMINNLHKLEEQYSRLEIGNNQQVQRLKGEIMVMEQELKMWTVKQVQWKRKQQQYLKNVDELQLKINAKTTSQQTQQPVITTNQFFQQQSHLKQTISTLQAKVSSLNTQNINYQQSIVHLNNNITDLQNQLHILTTDNINLFQDNKRFFTQNIQKNNLIKLLQQKSGSTTQKYTKLAQEKDLLQIQIKQVNQSFQIIKMHKADAERKRNQLEIRNSQLEGKNRELEVILDELKRKIYDYQIEIENKQKGSQIQKFKLIQNQVPIASSSQTQQVLKAKLQNVQKQLHNIKIYIKNTQQNIHQQTTKITILTEQNQSLTQNNDSLTEKNISLQQQLSLLQNKLSTTQTALTLNKQNQLQLQVQLQSLNHMINTLYEVKSQLIFERDALILNRDQLIIMNKELQKKIQQITGQKEAERIKHEEELKQIRNESKSIQMHQNIQQSNKSIQTTPHPLSPQLLNQQVLRNQNLQKAQQLSQLSQFLTQKQHLLSKRQTQFQTKKSLLIQLQQKLKSKFNKLEQKEHVLGEKENKFKENEDNMEETLLGAKKVLDLIEKKSRMVLKIKEKKRMVKENQRKEIQIKDRQIEIPSVEQVKNVQQSQKKQSQQQPKSTQNLQNLPKSQAHKFETQQDPASYIDLQTNLSNLQHKISCFLKSTKSLRQIRSAQLLAQTTLPLPHQQQTTHQFNQSLKDHQQLMQLISHIKQPQRKLSSQSNHNSNEIKKNKQLQTVMIYCSQLEGYVLKKYQNSDSSNMLTKETISALMEILQMNKLLLSVKDQNGLSKISDDIKETIDKLLATVAKYANKSTLLTNKSPLLTHSQTPAAQTLNLNQAQNFVLEHPLIRNQSLQFKKNKTPHKHVYSQIYSQRKPSQKYLQFYEYQKSQKSDNKVHFQGLQNQDFFIKQQQFLLPQKKKQRSILLIQDIGQAVSIDDNNDKSHNIKSKDQQQKDLSIYKSSGGNTSSVYGQQTKHLEKSFDFNNNSNANNSGMLVNTPQKVQTEKQYHSQVPRLLLSQTSSMSRKQMQEKYKTNMKNAKLSQKLKSKKKR